ncbi:hypothetical protein JRO89_XS05G0062400 [Xanthoceras sorbifolium]|uniref:Tetratricopeptide repeat protein 38 n=1 Tax=Xanthoceras sorbifolium TaxID=99658 RepID=A0ABQ8I0Q3_9ROSI|nr:hypothetical protein JRO89_XS05G0062400 [Xanthoceras sorbifolium]
MKGVKSDKWGYEVKTSSDSCISAINAYYHQVLSYGRERRVILEAPKHDKDCVLGNILAAHFLSSCDASKAVYLIQAAKSRLEEATLYEKAVFDAVSYLISADRDDDVAVELHSKLLKNFPRDLVSLKRAQVLCFYMGRLDLFLDLVQQVLPYNQQEDYIYGMLAFPLLELGRMADAEEAAKKGFEINKQDFWAQHAVNYFTIIYDFGCMDLSPYRKLSEAGYSILLLLVVCVMFFSTSAVSKKQCSSWKNAHLLGVLVRHSCMHIFIIYFPFVYFFIYLFVFGFYDAVGYKNSIFSYTHNWWHVAVCYLEGHSPMRKVLEIYDNHIWKELEKTDAVPPEVYLNALGLLLRVYVRGELDIFEDRLKIIADCVKDQANWYLEWHFDLLILWALAVTGELSKAEELLEGLKSRLSKMTKKKQQIMQIGIQLAEALYEYGRGNDKKALEFLGPDFDANACKMIGASDEQLDVFNEVWYSMLLNTGQAAKVIEVMEKQIKKREGNPYMWRLLERAYSMADRQEAATVGEKASALEAAHFEQTVAI